MEMAAMPSSVRPGFDASKVDEGVQAVIARIFTDFDANRLGLVQAADELERLFFSVDLMYRMRIHHRQVAWDPINRDGEGGNPLEVLLLASDIAYVGWSWNECAHATCCEVPVGDKTIETFNQRLCAGSGLAPVEEDSIQFGSLSCGHTNQALRAIAAEVPSDCPLLSRDGRMSLAKLSERDKHYAEAVQLGLPWKVVRRFVREKFPRALEILQATPLYLRTCVYVRTYVLTSTIRTYVYTNICIDCGC